LLFDRCAVLNKTRRVYLSSEAEVARSAYKRMKGLIGKPAREFTRGNALWIIPSNGIHTVGMGFPIDAAYLDSEGRVLKTYHRLSPFRIGAVRFRAKSVLELPAGTLAETHTEVGDVLEFRPISNGPKDSVGH
jgi:uncharacterized membrane protein (UPF0127 family)